MKVLKQFKLGDVVILLVLVIASFTPFYFFLPTVGKGSKIVAVVKANNRQVKQLSLDHDQTWTYRAGRDLNVVQVKGHRVRVVDANCKDQVCVKQGWKSKDGQTIVCLPHKFLIEVRDENKNDETDE